MAVSKTGNSFWSRSGASNATSQTWMGWFRPDNLPANNDFRAVFAQDGGTNNWMGAYIETANNVTFISLWSNNQNNAVVDGPTVTVSTWIFLAAVRSGTGTSWKFAWRLENESALTTATGTGSGTIGTNFRIGAENAGGLPQNGGYAYWRIYASALTDQQILEQSALTAASITVWADWPIDTTSNDTNDISGNNRPLTFTGSQSNTTGPTIALPVTEVFGTAAMDGGGSLEITGTREKAGTLLLPGGGSLELTGQTKTEVFGTAALDGGGALTLDGTKAKAGDAALDGGGAFELDGTREKSGTAVLDGGGDLLLDGSKAKAGSGLLDGGGDLTLDATKAKSGSGLLDGGGDFELDGSKSITGVAALLAGGGSLTLDGSKSKSGSGLLDGGGEFELDGHGPIRTDITVSVGASRNRDAFAVAASRLRPIATPAASRTRPLFAVEAAHGYHAVAPSRVRDLAAVAASRNRPAYAAAASRGGAFDVDGSRTKWSVGPSRIDRT
jgi:hypothetical protein